jgi:hypothetical protein
VITLSLCCYVYTAAVVVATAVDVVDLVNVVVDLVDDVDDLVDVVVGGDGLCCTDYLTMFSAQIIGSFHRLGRSRDVRVIKFLMKDTVEDRLVNLRESKAQQERETPRAMTHAEKRKACLKMMYEAFELTPPADPSRPALKRRSPSAS